MSDDSKNQINRGLISKFVQNLGQKNYADANKCLQKTIENKLLSRISQHKNINIFRDE